MVVAIAFSYCGTINFGLLNKNKVEVMDGKDTDYSGNIPSFRVLEREGKLSVGNLASAGGPILVVNKGQKDLDFVSKGVFERILFTTDWSPASHRALEYILGFKKLVKELDIVNVIYDKLTVRALRELKKRLIETRTRCLDEDIEAEYHLYAGETASEIILAAEEYDSTAIVMGLTHGQRLRDIFRGRPSCRVASRASLPTLIVP
jgi:nucleotide-binding universal stress UspA family protein